ncbi:MAG: hypothetical protein LIP77_12105 [Planctomycetes bacterium]|nr:hypothetical protein [Planctomycetota bacterium]
MAVGGVTGANGMMLQMMQLLLQGMEEQSDLAMKMVAAGVETGISTGKMALAQNIIDVYA